MDNTSQLLVHFVANDFKVQAMNAITILTEGIKQVMTCIVFH
jgi:hypothetical protein